MFANSARFAVVVAAFLWLSFRAPLPDARAQLAPGNPLLGGPNQAGPAIAPAAGLVPHPAGNVANVVGAPGVGPGLAAGGGAQADFDSLIDLIQSTVAADSWVENGGGQGDIRPFAGGVWVDSSGLVQRVNPSRDFSHPLLHATSFGADEVVADAADPRRTSRLRCVSLGTGDGTLDRTWATLDSSHADLGRPQPRPVLVGLSRYRRRRLGRPSRSLGNRSSRTACVFGNGRARGTG